MNKEFTLILLSYHHPYSRQFQILPFKDVSVEADVAGFLQTTEQQVSKCVLDGIYDYAAQAV